MAQPMTNDTASSGYSLTIVALTPTSGGYATIVANGTRISYSPEHGLRSVPGEPADGFFYEISDGKGAAWGLIEIIIDAGDIPAPLITGPPSSRSTLIKDFELNAH